MNPNETNPFAPTGAGSGTGSTSGVASSSSVPSSIDFTGMSSSNNGLSMADSLASAQDNLTSAGQAANMSSSTLGLDQLGANNPSATMDTPNTPLTPAAPVPGSIGSVTSVPPLKTADSANTPTTPPTTSSMPVMGGGSSGTAAPTSAAATPASTGYYNPFATNNAPTGGASMPTMPTSSTAVPPALRPQTEKFSDPMNSAQAGKQSKAKGGMGNILMIIAWAVAAVAIILAVFFFMQWQDAEGRAKEKEIVYVPSAEPGADEDEVSAITCQQSLGGEGIEGIENIVDHNRTVVVNYLNEGENHNLSSILLTDTYNFTDEAAVEAARWYFDAQAEYVAGIAGTLGVNPLSTGVVSGDNVMNYSLMSDGTNLAGEYVSMLMVPVDEGGVVNTDPDSLQGAYEAAGFICERE